MNVLSLKIGILTVSDRCYTGKNIDKSGPVLKELLLEDFPNAHILLTCVPDDVEEIKEKIVHWTDENKLDLIISSGGTGLSPRDVTPEAMTSICDTNVPCLEYIIQSESIKITPLAMLSRTTCSIRKKCLILNFPGSGKAVKENYTIIRQYLPVAVKHLKSLKIK